MEALEAAAMELSDLESAMQMKKAQKKLYKKNFGEEETVVAVE